MSKYQIFEPSQYLDWEKPIIEERIAKAANPPKSQEPPIKVSEYEVLLFNRNWDPFNPLFNNQEYAMEAGYPDIFAWPCFRAPMGAIGEVSISQTVAETVDALWCYAHGPNDVEMFAPIFPGDTLTAETENLMFEELTKPSSNLRHFKNGCTTRLYNQKGELVVRHTLWRREGYRKVIDGSAVMNNNDRMAALPEPPIHYTTDEEWEYIKELWAKEYIRGKDSLYWEDVSIGDEPAWICSGPVSYMDMIRWHGLNIPSNLDLRNIILNGAKELYRDPYGQYLFRFSGNYGGKNIPGKRSILMNLTPALLITRMVTNYIGDAGFVTRIGWMFQQTMEEMRYPREGGEYLDKVPYMKGKACTTHGAETDTVIAKGYVTDKYINDRGEHIIDLVCWGETLDKRIIEVVPASAKLPSREA